LDWGPAADNLSQKSLNQPLFTTLTTKKITSTSSQSFQWKVLGFPPIYSVLQINRLARKGRMCWRYFALKLWRTQVYCKSQW